MSGLPRVLVFNQGKAADESLIERLRENFEVVQPPTLETGLHELQQQDFSGLFLLGPPPSIAGALLQAGGILEQIQNGFALLSHDLIIQWCNSKMNQLTGRDGSLVGLSFYDALGTPEILGSDFCPFHTTLGSGEVAHSTLRVGEKTYYEVHTTPIFDNEADIPNFLMVMVRNVSNETLQRQKLNAIYQAGLELGDLSPEEILEMSVDGRVELLKSKIIHFTKDLLEFETVEIRLLNRKTQQLEPLLTVGMEPDAVARQLFAEAQGNGVTGFVAATGKSYLCEDTQHDPLYIRGAPDARSSLTVPVVLHDQVLGTFNVESPQPEAFTENDLQFLELFSREVAVALNTLDLLLVEKLTTVTKSTARIMREVANPVDEILNDTTWILERYVGHEPIVGERLKRVLKHTRDIKQLIQKVGESISLEPTYAPIPSRPERPKMRNKRVLVVDNDESVRQAAHELLERFGCEVETAHHGEEACLMVRSFHYDAVIVDICLPDMTGFECFSQLREIREQIRVILMTGFGYDPTHSIVKARQEGLNSVLYKPFRLDQLLAEVEKAVSSTTELAEP